MELKEAIERLCDLVSKVGEEEFKHTYAHDCFCGKNSAGTRVDEPVIEFIEAAVQVALESK